MSDRPYTDAPTLAPAIRARMADTIYEEFYAAHIPREIFDQQLSGRSDFDIANTAYDSFYKGKLPREQFNKQIGFGSASGSTQAAITSGMTMGLTDEVSGAVSGVASALRGEGFGAGYDRTTGAMRQNAEVFRQNNPYVGRGLEFAGGALATAPLATRNAAPMTMRRLMAQGAGIGAASGAGNAEGGLGERLQGAATGGAIGAALPPFLSVASSLLAPAWRGAVNLAGRGDPVQQSERQIAQALARGGQTTQDARNTLAAMPADKPITLADIGGPNVQAMGAVAANRPGPAMAVADNFVQARRFATPDRVAADVDRMIAPGSGSGVADTTQALIRKRSADAAPLYEEAFSRPVGAMGGQGRLREFIDDPITSAGLARGLEIQRLENVARAPGSRIPVADTAIRYGEDGTPKIVGVPNMRSLDAIKRGLDEMVEAYRDPTSGRLALDQRGRAIDSVRRSFVSHLDDQNDAYRVARAAWAGPSSAMDAVNLGRKIVSADRDAVARALDGLNEGNRDFFRLGVARALTDRTTDPSAAGNFVRKMVEDRTLAGKIRSVFDQPADYDNFVRSMEAELLMRNTNQAISPRAGSQTARLLSGMNEVDSGVGGGIAMDLMHIGARGGKPTWEMANRLVNRAKQGGADTAGEIGERIFTPDRALIEKFLSGVDRRQTTDALAKYQREELIRKLMMQVPAGDPGKSYRDPASMPR